VDDVLRVNRSLVIPLDELEWRFTASGGPGGQHANRSNTRAEVRLVERFGPVVRVVVDAERSQRRNRVLAQERLAARLAAALRVDPPRTPTKPTAGSRQRRLSEKRRRGEQKRQRQRPPSDDG